MIWRSSPLLLACNPLLRLWFRWGRTSPTRWCSWTFWCWRSSVWLSVGSRLGAGGATMTCMCAVVSIGASAAPGDVLPPSSLLPFSGCAFGCWLGCQLDSINSIPSDTSVHGHLVMSCCSPPCSRNSYNYQHCYGLTRITIYLS
jgi:hypothetical protein